jgi:hypothetical protein
VALNLLIAILKRNTIMITQNMDSAFPAAIGQLQATLIHADGTHNDYGIVSDDKTHRFIGRPIQWWRMLWNAMKQVHLIPSTMGFSTFLKEHGTVDNIAGMLELFKNPRVVDIIMGRNDPLYQQIGLVVTGGANYLATDMISGLASPRIGSMQYHDSGTGAVAATSTDSGLGGAAGPATRATGSASNPTANVYKSVGIITYTGGLAITEWGLFSAAAQGSGTMWDRRVFTAINVVSTDSIQFTYQLTVNAGGS